MKKPKSSSKQASQRVRYSFLKILTGSDLSRRRLPLMAVESPKPGPVVWLTGCIHGDEVSGMVAIQEVFKRIRKHPLLRGTLYSFPLMNPIGFESGSRNITLSREDLNRAFPGSSNGSLAERIAERIFSTIKQTRPNLVLDLHSDWIKSIPYTLIDQKPGRCRKQVYERTEMIAKKSGFLVVLDNEESAKSFSYNLLQDNIPALTIELGESYVVSEKNVRNGVESILAILAHLEMVEGTDEPFSLELPQGFTGKVLKFSSGPASAASGIIRFLANPGDLVKKSQPVSKIYNPFGKLLDTVLCPGNGIVLGHPDSSVAFPGAPVMALGLL